MTSGVAALEVLPRGDGDQSLRAGAGGDAQRRDRTRIAPTIAAFAGWSARLRRARVPPWPAPPRRARNSPPAPALLPQAAPPRAPPAPSRSAVRLQSVLDHADCGCGPRPK